MEIVGFLTLATLVIKIVGVIKAIGKDTTYVATMAVTWEVGIAVLFLAAEAEVTEHLVPPGFSVALGVMDVASVILAGLILGSTGAFAYDYKKARDNTDSASEPSILSTTPTEYIPLGCNCGKNKNRYQVKVGGKIVFVSSNQATAQSVANRYPGGEVVEIV